MKNQKPLKSFGFKFFLVIFLFSILVFNCKNTPLYYYFKVKTRVIDFYSVF